VEPRLGGEEKEGGEESLQPSREGREKKRRRKNIDNIGEEGLLRTLMVVADLPNRGAPREKKGVDSSTTAGEGEKENEKYHLWEDAGGTFEQ